MQRKKKGNTNHFWYHYWSLSKSSHSAHLICSSLYSVFGLHDSLTCEDLKSFWDHLNDSLSSEAFEIFGDCLNGSLIKEAFEIPLTIHWLQKLLRSAYNSVTIGTFESAMLSQDVESKLGKTAELIKGGVLFFSSSFPVQFVYQTKVMHGHFFKDTGVK